MKVFIYITTMVFLVFGQAAFASNREERKIGIHQGVMSSPFGMLALGGAYNFTDYIQAHAGLGDTFLVICNVFTTGGGINLFIPGQNFSPTLGGTLGYARSECADFSLGDGRSSPNQRDKLLAYPSVGVDYQAANGFNIGVGSHLVIRGVGDEIIPFMPYVQFGWFF